MEAGASLDELVDFGFVAPGRITHAKALASRVVSMLVGLIRSTPDDDPGPTGPEESGGSTERR
ncbi:MAG TPA: hypothetical protein VF039_03160 [Longimicrobiales bacterium]